MSTPLCTRRPETREHGDALHDDDDVKLEVSTVGANYETVDVKAVVGMPA
jgi:hypothetical protein